MRGTCCLIAALLIGGAAHAQDNEQAEALYREYREVSGQEEREPREERFDALRRLGRVDAPRAREVLTRIARTARSRDDRILAMLSLGRIADVAAAEALVEMVERKTTPARAEILSEALALASRAEVERWIAVEGLAKARKPEVLRAVLRAVTHPDAEGRLVELYRKHSAKDGQIEIAFEAIRGLGRIGGEKVLAFLREATSHADHRIRLAAAQALPLQEPMGDRALSALRTLMGDTSAAVRQSAARGVGRAKVEALVPQLIGLLGEARLLTRYEAYRALKSISGRDYSLDSTAWAKWWELRQKELDYDGAYETISFARYYGVGVFSDRVVFLVDLSGSMRWDKGRPPTRIEIARTQLKRVLPKLDSKAYFNIVVYADQVAAWKRREVPATKENVEDALNWVDSSFAEPEGETHTYDAFKKVFSANPMFDTIYFLSDGIPSHGTYVCHEGILASIRAWNRFRRSVIHTFALTLTRGVPQLERAYAGERMFMREIAAGSGGECRLIAHPPK